MTKPAGPGGVVLHRVQEEQMSHPGRIIPQDILPQDGHGNMITALPVTQDEIDDLLYGEDRSASERLERLQEIAAALREEEQGDFGDNDPGRLLGEIEEAIARLSGDLNRDPEMADNEPSMDDDPTNHRETLSPDSDELETLEDEDEASIEDDEQPLEDEVLDPEEWSEDGFAVERGVK